MSKSIVVWDPLVRVGHWTIVIAFAVAYFSGDDLLSVHAWAGYVVGAAVVIRGLWGFIGPQHARFSDFVYSPRTILAYLADLVRLHAVRYVGHSPAGGVMVIALLFMLAATVATGVMTLGADKHTGPLASFYRVETPPVAESSAPKRGPTALRAGGDEHGSRQPAHSDESVLSELHEVLANITLILIGFHVAGVALASIVHRENLVLAMITGRKRAQTGPPDS